MQWKIHHSYTCSTSDVRSIGHGELRTHFQLGIVEVDVIFPTTLDLEVDRGPLDDGGQRTKLLNILPWIADWKTGGSKRFSSDPIASILLSN